MGGAAHHGLGRREDRQAGLGERRALGMGAGLAGPAQQDGRAAIAAWRRRQSPRPGPPAVGACSAITTSTRARRPGALAARARSSPAAPPSESGLRASQPGGSKGGEPGAGGGAELGQAKPLGEGRVGSEPAPCPAHCPGWRAGPPAPRPARLSAGQRLRRRQPFLEALGAQHAGAAQQGRHHAIGDAVRILQPPAGAAGPAPGVSAPWPRAAETKCRRCLMRRTSSSTQEVAVSRASQSSPAAKPSHHSRRCR
jgi:hypothetical protein